MDVPSPRRSPDWCLWRTWVAWVTVGETLGFLVPALIGVLTVDYPTAASLPALLLAGAVEGAILGGAQAIVLHRVLPGFPVRTWVAATSGAAVLAWLIGMAPVAFAGSIDDWPIALVVASATILGALLLLSIGTAQWTVLRHHVDGAWRWIAVTALAWLAGLTVFMLVAPPLWREGQPIALIVAIGAFAGLLMASTVAAVTGFGLIWLLRTVQRVLPD